MVTYFADAEEELFHVNEQPDKTDDPLDARIANVFAVLNNFNSSSPASPLLNIVNQNSYGFIPVSIFELKGILDTMTLFSNASADQHVVLDTGAPHSICSKYWLQKAN